MPVAATLLAIASMAGAEGIKDRLAVDGQVGTTGIGISLHHRFSNKFIIRTGLQYAELDAADEDYDGVQYDLSADLSGATATIDYHPFQNGFTISSGLFYGKDPGFSLDGTPDSDVEIGGNIYTPEQVGVISGTVQASELMPYVGAGWDSTYYSDRRVNVFVRAGMLFSASPDVRLSAEDGLLSEDPGFLADLLLEQENVEDEIDGLKIYPVLNIGFSYRP